MHQLIKFAFVSLLFFMRVGHAQSHATVTICGDPNPAEWVTVTENVVREKDLIMVGYSAKITKSAFLQMGIEVRLIGNLPWKRCLNEVQNGNIDFAMGAYFNEERAKVFDYSVHYNTLTPQIFYLKSNPVNVSQPGDLKHYRGCGIYGSSYMHYGIKNDDLDLGAGYDSLIRKLHARRCDFFVEELEIIGSFKTIGKDVLNDSAIGHANVAWAVAPSRYLITAKGGKNSALLQQINETFEAMIKSGKAQTLWSAESGNVPYKP